MMFDPITGQIYVAKNAGFHHDDMSKFALKDPTGTHYLSTRGLVHTSALCAGEYATVLPWVVLDVLWEHAQAQGTKGRNVGWCEKCSITTFVKEAVA